MKKIKVFVISLVTVTVLSIGLNNPEIHQNISEKAPVVQHMTGPRWRNLVKGSFPLLKNDNYNSKKSLFLKRNGLFNMSNTPLSIKRKF
ncbi:Phr family secreted Rap phosphatase inhibitor [Bacillus paranthracis]